MYFPCKETDRLHQSTDSLADSSSKGIDEFLRNKNIKYYS